MLVYLFYYYFDGTHMYGFCAFRSQLRLTVPFRNFRNGILCSAHAAWDQQGRPSSSSQPVNEWRRPARESHLITPIQEKKKRNPKTRNPARLLTAAAQRGTEGERRASARKRRLFVLEHVFVCGAQPRWRTQTKEERGAAAHLRFLLSAVLLQPPSVMKQASTLLCPFGLLYFC